MLAGKFETFEYLCDIILIFWFICFFNYSDLPDYK